MRKHRPSIDLNYIQIAILGNHLNGKDTHVRGLRVFSHKKYVMSKGSLSDSVAHTSADPELLWERGIHTRVESSSSMPFFDDSTRQTTKHLLRIPPCLEYARCLVLVGMKTTL